jgi:hypothetical protein
VLAVQLVDAPGRDELDGEMAVVDPGRRQRRKRRAPKLVRNVDEVDLDQGGISERLTLLAPGLGLSDSRRLLLGVLVVGRDDPLHELVAHHVLAPEADELDPLHLLEDVADHD